MSKISLVRGTSKEIGFALSTPDGKPYMLTDGDILRFGVKKTAQDKAYQIRKDLTASDQNAEGLCVMKLKPSDTAELYLGCYRYDVGLQTGDDYIIVIEEADFVLRSNVTTYEGG